MLGLGNLETLWLQGAHSVEETDKHTDNPDKLHYLCRAPGLWRQTGVQILGPYYLYGLGQVCASTLNIANHNMGE